MLPLGRDDYLVVGSINIHDIYLDTQLRTIYSDINIVEIYPGTNIAYYKGLSFNIFNA